MREAGSSLGLLAILDAVVAMTQDDADVDIAGSNALYVALIGEDLRRIVQRGRNVRFCLTSNPGLQSEHNSRSVAVGDEDWESCDFYSY